MCDVYAGAKQGEVELRRVVVKIFADNLAFWNLRAAQGYWRVAQFSWQAAYFFSGRCALRRGLWRVAPSIQN
ncbi:hypothetical protein A2U01_0091629 [Trifolium medium]|uniref:Uncharacterized protein n=1 Tax=Trifolium medium TaxID=97028 RepID=A0A392UD72_9FABA|nr:hypothetical protein [Trifolium medium]